MVKKKNSGGKSKKKQSLGVDNFLFDDCVICQAQKVAIKEGRSLGPNEVQAAFRKANRRQEQEGRKNSQIKGPAFSFQVTMRGKKKGKTVAVSSNATLFEFAEQITAAYALPLDHCFGFFNEFRPGRYSEADEKYELFTDLFAEGEDIEPTGAGSVKRTKVKEVWKKSGDKMLFLFDYGEELLWDIERTS